MSRRIALLSAAMMLPASTFSAHAMPMNGTFTMRYDKQSPQPIGKNRIKIDESGSGINKSPGQPLDNAQVTITETVNLANGKGPVKGIITFTTPNGSTITPYTGKVVTDAQGRMTASGKFKVGDATGAFTGLRGSGSFTTAFSSQIDQVTEWQGDFKPPTGAAASR